MQGSPATASLLLYCGTHNGALFVLRVALESAFRLTAGGTVIRTEPWTRCTPANAVQSSYLIACQGQIIGLVDKGVLQVSGYFIEAPVALHTEEVDHDADPCAVHKGYHHQWHRDCIHDQHDQHHLRPGEREGCVCNSPAVNKAHTLSYCTSVCHSKGTSIASRSSRTNAACRPRCESAQALQNT